MNALTGMVLKRLGKVRRTVFYCIDFAEQRFQNRFLNAVYHWVDLTCARSCDETWNLSTRILALREKQGISRQKLAYVPVGVYPLAKRPTPMYKNRIIYFGAVDFYKGVAMAVDAFPRILKQIPNAEMVIMGDGPAFDDILRRINGLGIQKSVRLMGRVSYEQASLVLSQGGIGLAPFSPAFISPYADPQKVKEYLRFGCPVVITNVPAIHEEIDTHKAGLVIKYDSDELVRAVVTLMSNGAYFESCGLNAFEMAKSYNWSAIFGRVID